MSFEERASSWALSLVDALETDAGARLRVIAATGGVVGTICMWLVHLTYPAIFNFFVDVDDWVKLFIGFTLAPPFIGAYSIGSFLYHPPVESKEDESGPMSTYFYQEKATMRWKLLMVAAFIAGLNLVLMFIASQM